MFRQSDKQSEITDGKQIAGAPCIRRRTDRLLAGGLFVTAFLTYLVTLAPGLLMNDSAEFQTLAWTVGHTHPTGYPVYILLGKLCTLVPAGNIAWRVNLLSAILSAAAVTLLFLTGRLLTGRRWLPWAGGAMLAVSPTLWSQAIIAEVYAPAAAAMLLVIYGLVQWQTSGRLIWLMVSAAAGGLSLGVHLTVSLLAPAALLFVLSDRNRWRGLRASLVGAVAGTAITFIAFWVVDRSRPPSDYFVAVVEPSRSAWGLAADELDDPADRLRFSLSAVQYRENLASRPLDQIIDQVQAGVENLPNEIPPLWLLAAAVGLIRLCRDNPRLAMLTLLTFAAHTFYVLRHNMGDIHVGYIPLYLLLSLWSVCCLGVGRRTAAAGRGGKGLWRFTNGLVPAVLMLAAIWPLFRNDAWTDEGRRTTWVAPGEPSFRVGFSQQLEDSITTVVADLEDDALLFTDWGLLYAYYYVAHVEQRRTSLRFVQSTPAIGQTRLADSALELIRTQLPDRPIYLSEPRLEVLREFDLQLVRRGDTSLYRIRRRGERNL